MCHLTLQSTPQTTPSLMLIYAFLCAVGTKPFHCPGCDMAFVTSCELGGHFSRVHGGAPPGSGERKSKSIATFRHLMDCDTSTDRSSVGSADEDRATAPTVKSEAMLDVPVPTMISMRPQALPMATAMPEPARQLCRVTRPAEGLSSTACDSLRELCCCPDSQPVSDLDWLYSAFEMRGGSQGCTSQPLAHYDCVLQQH